VAAVALAGIAMAGAAPVVAVVPPVAEVRQAGLLVAGALAVDRAEP